MSDTIAVALLTGILTIVASAGTAWVTLRHQRTVAQDDRRERRRLDAREVIVEMLPAARSFSRSWSVWAPTMGMMQSKEEVLKFLSEILELDTGKDYAAQMEKLTRTLTRANLTVSDPDLRSAVADLRLLVEGVSSEITGKILKAVTAGGDTIPVIGQSLAYVDLIGKTIDRVEERAGEIMRAEL
ncbi:MULTISPECIES: hypothetical protein [unclassified Curtobacterium]|uniref:hypothetical protein n=1 Tax=unclassified Curtobacterium TaxID=257496 RepID=UPI0039AEE71B